jgi:hypothetical protein
MNKKYLAIIGVLALIITTAAVSVATNASSPDEERGNDHFGKARMQHERPDFENLTFEEFAAQKESKRVLENVNADNFEQFKQMHELMQSGDREGANSIREEIGLPDKEFGPKHKKGMRKGTHENKEAVMQAFENNDYQAWSELMEGKPVLEKVNEDNFSKLVDAHNLAQSGDFEGAKLIKDELGLAGKGSRGGCQK